MKKLYFLIILLTYFFGVAQCPNPTNLIVSGVTGTSVQLNWTENGSANQWEVYVAPINSSWWDAPTTGIVVSTNSFTITNLFPSGCYVFYVRSICSPIEVSQWSIPTASGSCSVDVYNYIASLSNNNINFDNKEVTLYPNPAQKTLQLQTKTATTFDKIIITDLSGKIILAQTQNTNQVNVEQLSNGVYFIEVFAGDEKFTSKFVKE